MRSFTQTAGASGVPPSGFTPVSAPPSKGRGRGTPAWFERQPPATSAITSTTPIRSEATAAAVEDRVTVISSPAKGGPLPRDGNAFILRAHPVWDTRRTGNTRRLVSVTHSQE